MLPAEDNKTRIVKDTRNNTLKFEPDWFDDSYSKLQYLYLVSHRKIKEGDYYYDNLGYPNVKRVNHLHLIQQDYPNNRIKIEATTDEDLASKSNLPLIPQSFIETYVEKQGKIEEVEVEMEVVERIKINNNNKCIISILQKEEKLYTKEEMKKRLFQLWQYVPQINETFEDYLEALNY